MTRDELIKLLTVAVDAGLESHEKLLSEDELRIVLRVLRCNPDVGAGIFKTVYQAYLSGHQCKREEVPA